MDKEFTSTQVADILIKEKRRIQIVVWLSLQGHVLVHWPMVTAKHIIKARVLFNLNPTRCVVSEQYSVRVRWALVLFVDVFVVVLLSFVRRQEVDDRFLVVRENKLFLPYMIKLIHQLNILVCLLHVANKFCERGPESKVQISEHKREVSLHVRFNLG